MRTQAECVGALAAERNAKAFADAHTLLRDVRALLLDPDGDGFAADRMVDRIDLILDDIPAEETMKCALADLIGSWQAYAQNDIHAHDWRAHVETIREVAMLLKEELPTELVAQRYEVETLMGHGWENCWADDGVVLTFASREEAQTEINDLLRRTRRLWPTYKDSDYRIVIVREAV